MLCQVNISISIHSTARVETAVTKVYSQLAAISIHSTARVETPRGERIALLLSQFQSTPPRGWRQGRAIVQPAEEGISIHSTARVETCVGCDRLIHWTISIHSTARVETYLSAFLGVNPINFNPLHREGGDLIALDAFFLLFDFNPLHREGGDYDNTAKATERRDFNPLHREGGDVQGTT